MKKLFVFTLILTATFFYFKRDAILNVTDIKESSSSLKKKIAKKEIKINSVKKGLTSKPKLIPKDSKTSIKEDKERQEIKNTYFTNISKDLDIKITKVKSTTIKLHGRNKEVHHVIVKTKKKTGPASSFEALVDPNSSMIYKTWNQTRFETNKAFKVKAAGLEFYSK